MNAALRQSNKNVVEDFIQAVWFINQVVLFEKQVCAQ